MSRPADIYLHMAITRYLHECRTYKHLAGSTVGRYRNALNRFAASLGKGGQSTLVRKIPPQAWRDHVSSYEHHSAKYYNCQLSAISAFVKWCYDEGLLSPTDRHLRGMREKPVMPARAKTYVTQEQLPAVLAAGEEWHVRDRYFMSALWHSWRRSGELSAVRVRDVDLSPYPDSPHGRMIWTNQKAHRPDQCLDMSPGLNQCLREWLRIYEELAGEAPNTATART
jgi:site-specific recombinase XerD